MGGILLSLPTCADQYPSFFAIVLAILFAPLTGVVSLMIYCFTHRPKYEKLARFSALVILSIIFVAAIIFLFQLNNVKK